MFRYVSVALTLALATAVTACRGSSSPLANNADESYDVWHRSELVSRRRTDRRTTSSVTSTCGCEEDGDSARQELIRFVRHARSTSHRPICARSPKRRPSRPARAPGSDAQKIGDFYESFMDEARVEEIGMKPLESELAAIDRLRTQDGSGAATSRACSSSTC